MTDKELKKLNRRELLELLIEEMKENEELRKKLEEREIKLASSGNIAEAALQINKVFEAAQAAADQYIVSVKNAEGTVWESVTDNSEKSDFSAEEIAMLEGEKALLEKEKERLLKKEKKLREIEKDMLDARKKLKAIEKEYRYLKRFHDRFGWLSSAMDEKES